MDTYGRQWVAPATPSRGRNKGHQRYSSLQEPPFPDYYRNRALPGSCESPRSSLPLPGGRPSPKSLPPQHNRRQSAAESQQPHYVTPTRARQRRNANTYPGSAAPIELGQWEQLRSRGFVLKGAGVQARPTVTFAPALAVIPVSRLEPSSSWDIT